MTLTGRQPNIQCETVGLDHSSIPDYVSKGDFDANTEGPHENGWGSCHKVNKILNLRCEYNEKLNITNFRVLWKQRLRQHL